MPAIQSKIETKAEVHQKGVHSHLEQVSRNIAKEDLNFAKKQEPTLEEKLAHIFTIIHELGYDDVLGSAQPAKKIFELFFYMIMGYNDFHGEYFVESSVAKILEATPAPPNVTENTPLAILRDSLVCKDEVYCHPMKTAKFLMRPENRCLYAVMCHFTSRLFPHYVKRTDLGENENFLFMFMFVLTCVTGKANQYLTPEQTAAKIAAREGYYLYFAKNDTITVETFFTICLENPHFCDYSETYSVDGALMPRDPEDAHLEFNMFHHQTNEDRMLRYSLAWDIPSTTDPSGLSVEELARCDPLYTAPTSAVSVKGQCLCKNGPTWKFAGRTRRGLSFPFDSSAEILPEEVKARIEEANTQQLHIGSIRCANCHVALLAAIPLRPILFPDELKIAVDKNFFVESKIQGIPMPQVPAFVTAVNVGAILFRIAYDMNGKAKIYCNRGEMIHAARRDFFNLYNDLFPDSVVKADEIDQAVEKVCNILVTNPVYRHETYVHHFAFDSKKIYYGLRGNHFCYIHSLRSTDRQALRIELNHSYFLASQPEAINFEAIQRIMNPAIPGCRVFVDIPNRSAPSGVTGFSIQLPSNSYMLDLIHNYGFCLEHIERMRMRAAEIAAANEEKKE